MDIRDDIKRIKEVMGVLMEQRRIPFKMNIPEDIMGIKDIFKKNGYELYVVGGAVRDSIEKKIPKDYDLVTDAVPNDVERILNDGGYRTLPTGKQFGVINVFTNRGEYEIATMREDIGSGRRPDSVRFADIETDSKRRDLTINALYYDIDRGDIIDLVGGYDDIINNVIRTVGEPRDRFDEDRLRIMRVIRFAGRMGSDLDPSIKETLKMDAGLDNISGERIRDEFIKGIISSRSVKYFLSLLEEYKLFDWIFRGLTIKRMFIDEHDPVLVISSLLMGNDVDRVQKTLNTLKYTIDEVRNIVFLMRFVDLSPENAVMLKRMQMKTSLNDEQIKKFSEYHQMDSKLVDVFINFKLTVKGDDIMAKMNLSAGKEVGDIINRIEYNNFLSGIARTNIEN